MLLKHIFYDLAGLNQFWFLIINRATASGDMDSILWLITELGSRHYFAYWLAGVACAGLATWGVQKMRGELLRLASLRVYVLVLATMLVGYGLNGLAIGTLKSHFAYPRPFVEMGTSNVHYAGTPMEESEYFKSFPSGHAGFIALMIISLWPLLSTPLARMISLGVILAVMWSRIALGVHYPVDVVAGALIGTINALIAGGIATHALTRILPLRTHAA